MAGDWIKMRTNLDTDPAVVRIASGLKTDRYSVVGRLHKVWAWANEHLTDGQDVPIDSAFLDALVETPGFAEQLRRVGWLSGRDGSLEFPSFERHNGASAKARAMDAERKKSVRKMSGSNPDKKRTREEKRREEKNNNSISFADGLIIPLNLQTDAFGEMWRKWKQHLFQIHKNYSATTEQHDISELSRWDHDDAVAAVKYSIDKGAKNLIRDGSHRVEFPNPSRTSFKQQKISYEVAER